MVERWGRIPGPIPAIEFPAFYNDDDDLVAGRFHCLFLEVFSIQWEATIVGMVSIL